MYLYFAELWCECDVCLPAPLSLHGAAANGRGCLQGTLLQERSLQLLHGGARYWTMPPLHEERGRDKELQVSSLIMSVCIAETMHWLRNLILDERESESEWGVREGEREDREMLIN